MFEAPDPEELSELLPGYDVIDLIATGGMGAVYRAEQIALQRQVALKILPRELSRQREFEKSFRAEAKAMARLRHPNLIGIHDFGEVDGFLYLIMDFVAGKSLYRSAHGRAIDQQEAIRLVHGICKGMAHAHEEGIIHRDLKPANILLDSDKQPRIGDFGLARPADGSGGDGMHFGTPDYCAPEVMKGPANADARSDVFAIGVILYELLTGELPGDNYVPPSQLEEIDPRFDRIVRRAIHPSPAMRFADAGEMATATGELKENLCKPGSKLVTGSPSGEGSPSTLLRTGQKPTGTDPAPAALAHAATKAHDRTVRRNLVIITILLLAIPLVWSAYNRKKNDLDRQREQAEREDAAREAVADSSSRSADMGVADEMRPRRLDRPDAEVTPTPSNTPTPIPDRDLTLAGLRASLASGSRARFPADAFDLGDRKALFVDNPHNWQEASRFAEEHGGHLATIPDETVRAAVLESIPAGVTIWLGGGLSGPSDWSWVDGRAWTLSEKPSDPRGRYLSLSSTGAIEATSGKNRFPFIVVWQMDGENPGSAEAQLTRLKKSLGQPNPHYPPGTLSNKDRRYLVTENTVSWDEAAELARSSGGYLAVPSDEAENDYLRAALTAILPEGSAAWIGGRFRTGAWTWVTGEPWTFKTWAPKPDHALKSGHTALCLRTGTDGGWDNVDPNAEGVAAAYVVEWSNDRRTERTPGPVATPPDIAELKAQAASTTASKQEKHAEMIQQSGEFMDRDLVDWLNHGLHKRTRAKWRKHIASAQQRILPSGRINREAELPALPEDIANRCNEYIAKQATIDAQFEASIENDREDFLDKLNKGLALACSERLLDQIASFEKEIEAVGETTTAFLDYLSSEEAE